MALRPPSPSEPSSGELAPLVADIQQALTELAAVSEKERQSVDMARLEAERANQNLVDVQTAANQRIAAAQEKFDDAYRQAAAVGQWPAAEPGAPRAPAGRQRRSHHSSTTSSATKRTRTPQSAMSGTADSPQRKVPSDAAANARPSVSAL
ncbi:hypothetical protein [Fodinicola feengrottensis]|uniref:Uncharacterized protein n=1 Tax=Fodinicola feengrottensis TaxID=435914 RepID=A0ABN2FRG7_9ACTN|nr:hypothetical protein [Fodinicola feengrottensis]